MKNVKPIFCAMVVGSAVFISSCESTPPGQGNQEVKRRAAVERYNEQSGMDEAHANLWHAQNSVLDRDNNPLRAY